MPQLFRETLNGENWGEMFQSIDAFTPLVREIFTRHGLEAAEIGNLTPGSNAVFQVGDKVVKIFAPEESGYCNNDYEIELESLRHANRCGVSAPKLLFQGVVADKYRFPYLIMEHIGGREAEDAIPAMTEAEKKSYALQLKGIAGTLNIPLTGTCIPRVTVERCLANTRWNRFPRKLREEREARVKALSLDEALYVHGDLTAENMIIHGDGTVYAIDFADSRIGPSWYEWPPIVFAQFGCDNAMMEAYFGDYRNDAFYDRLLDATLIHEFGATLAEQLCELWDRPLDGVDGLGALRALLVEALKSGGAKLR